MSDTESAALAKGDAEVEVVEEPTNAKPIRPKRASVAKKRKANDSEEEDAYEEVGEDEEDAPAPKKKAKTQTTLGKKATSKASSKPATKSKSADPFSIALDGDDDESVPILDSCDELRKKINVHLDVSGQNKAAFLRDIARAGWPSNPPKIQSKQLTDFQTKKGPTAGNTSKVCYGAYVYFEKLRVAKGEPKSRHRNGMEKQWGAAGMHRSANRGIWCAPGERPVVNAYGGVSFK